jgi:dsRNA-specific ribonuclease
METSHLVIVMPTGDLVLSQGNLGLTAETFEAIIAAIYKDGGYEIIRKLVVKWFS